MPKTKKVPMVVSAGAMYPYSEELVEQFTTYGTYGDTIELFRVIEPTKGKKYILLPRNCVPPCPNVRMDKGIPINLKSKGFKARNTEQENLIKQSIALLKDGHSFLLESYTGSGKTVMATQIIAGFGKKTIVVFTKEDIRDQWYKAFLSFTDIKPSEIGLIQGNACTTIGKKVILASLQTLYPMGKLPKSVYTGVGLLIIDECHRVASEQFSNVCWQIPAQARLGLSATPKRKDGRDVVLESHIGKVLVRNTTTGLVPRVLMVNTDFDVPMVTREVDGYKQRVRLPHSAGRTMGLNLYLAKDVARNRLITNLIKSAYKKGRAILVQSDLREHLVTLHEFLVSSGVPDSAIGFYVGGLKTAERASASVKPIILATYGSTAEATDIPWLDTLLMATPRSDVVQIVGRILREYENKQEPLVIDLVDVTSAVLVGYANRRREWYSIQGAKVTKK